MGGGLDKAHMHGRGGRVLADESARKLDRLEFQRLPRTSCVHCLLKAFYREETAARRWHKEGQAPYKIHSNDFLLLPCGACCARPVNTVERRDPKRKRGWRRSHLQCSPLFHNSKRIRLSTTKVCHREKGSRVLNNNSLL